MINFYDQVIWSSSIIKFYDWALWLGCMLVDYFLLLILKCSRIWTFLSGSTNLESKNELLKSF